MPTLVASRRETTERGERVVLPYVEDGEEKLIAALPLGQPGQDPDRVGEALARWDALAGTERDPEDAMREAFGPSFVRRAE